MRITRSKARLISEITIDQDIPMATYGLTGCGDIVIGANKLKMTNCLLKQEDATHLVVKNVADTARSGLNANELGASSNFQGLISAISLKAIANNNGTLLLKAYDNDDAIAEVARLVGAVDPYFQATLPMRFLPTSEPGAVLEGMVWYNRADDILKCRDASATRDIIMSNGFMGVIAVKKQITFESGVTTTVVTLPAGSLVVAAVANVTTTFDGTTPTVSVGIAGWLEVYLTASNIGCEVAGWKGGGIRMGGLLFKAGYNWTTFLVDAEQTVIATMTETDTTQGVVDIYLIFIKLH